MRLDVLAPTSSDGEPMNRSHAPPTNSTIDQAANARGAVAHLPDDGRISDIIDGGRIHTEINDLTG